jgi:hypothetical protein
MHCGGRGDECLEEGWYLLAEKLRMTNLKIKKQICRIFSPADRKIFQQNKFLVLYQSVVRGKNGR